MNLDDIDFNGGEQNICHDCADKIGGRGGGKSDKLDEVVDINVYEMFEL